jgi:hypothetical protein
MSDGLPSKSGDPPSQSPFLDWLDSFKRETGMHVGGWLEDALLRAWLSGRLYQMHRDVMREEREKGRL